jgi:hypothetical protein
MEAIADMMDRALRPLEPGDGAPDHGGSSEAGKAIIRQITAAARAQLEQVKQAKDARQMIHNGATHDNR